MPVRSPTASPPLTLVNVADHTLRVRGARLALFGCLPTCLGGFLTDWHGLRFLELTGNSALALGAGVPCELPWTPSSPWAWPESPPYIAVHRVGCRAAVPPGSLPTLGAVQ